MPQLGLSSCVAAAQRDGILWNRQFNEPACVGPTNKETTHDVSTADDSRSGQYIRYARRRARRFPVREGRPHVAPPVEAIQAAPEPEVEHVAGGNAKAIPQGIAEDSASSHAIARNCARRTASRPSGKGTIPSILPATSKVRLGWSVSGLTSGISNVYSTATTSMSSLPYRQK